MAIDTHANIAAHAVRQLRAYARYIDEHAESIIGDIDRPHYVTESGIHIGFTLLEHESIPVLEVRKEYLVLDVLKADKEVD